MNGRIVCARIAPILVATVMGLGASIALAQGESNEESDPTTAQLACAFIGCENGARVCGTVSWTETFWLPTTIPVPWEFRTSATCYEGTPSF